jgi:hypothetical protein
MILAIALVGQHPANISCVWKIQYRANILYIFARYCILLQCNCNWSYCGHSSFHNPELPPWLLCPLTWCISLSPLLPARATMLERNRSAKAKKTPRRVTITHRRQHFLSLCHWRWDWDQQEDWGAFRSTQSCDGVQVPQKPSSGEGGQHGDRILGIPGGEAYHRSVSHSPEEVVGTSRSEAV